MKKIVFWIVAFLITLSAAVYQRFTGPTHPIQGEVRFDSHKIQYTLPRSHETTKDCTIEIDIKDLSLSGRIKYRHFKLDEPWIKKRMTRKQNVLEAVLPKQPAAGKLEYKIILSSEKKEISLAGDDPVIIRFKDPVPDCILIPHVIIMFFAMLFSTRAGIEALNPKSNPRKYALWTAAFLFVGGMILGPLVQKFAFGQLWTGFPFGTDLTDNKTLIAMLGWLAAVIAGRKGKPARGWVLGASILLLVIYLIPHSLFGSELDYTKLPQGK
ncbi:MAG: hypothetical protein ACOC5F_03380 [Candidatus Aminicenantaceae bacterium]